METNNDEINIVINSIIDFNYQEMSIGDIPTIVIEVMQVVETIKGKTGAEKKQLVIDVVTRLVDDSDIAGNSEIYILPMIPTLIDKLVEVDNGKLRINIGVKKSVVKFFNTVKQLFKNCKCKCN